MAKLFSPVAAAMSSGFLRNTKTKYIERRRAALLRLTVACLDRQIVITAFPQF